MTKDELAYCISELDRIHDDYYFPLRHIKTAASEKVVKLLQIKWIWPNQ